MGKEPESTILTSLLSNDHGRQRRQERGIEKVDLQRARRYGMKEKARNGCYKFTYGGIVFIYDPKTNREVTSWPCKDFKYTEGTSGTKVAKPLLLSTVNVTYQMIQHRHQTRQELLADKKKWTSHSVLVVDMSGSMRRDDVNGAKCRSDGVWLSLARDYVKIPLENKSRSMTDLISIVVMREEAEILLACEPTDYCLYNKLVELREWDELRPAGPGCYGPALQKAQELLNINTKGSCALALLFFSDGRPSDFHGNHKGKMGQIASKFGRRLSINCVGMAAPVENETFQTLRDMATEADSFGSVASFGSASLDTDSLSKIMSSLASSLTETKTEMTDFHSGKSLSVRMDIRREKKGAPDDLFLNNDWKTYSGSRFGRSWVWSYEHNDYAQLFDFRCIACNKDTRSSTDSTCLKHGAIICPVCKSACFCNTQCHLKGYPDHVAGSWNMEPCQHLQESYIEGKQVKRPVLSYAMAIKKQIFGEGAERIVSKLRYLDEQNSFHGPRLVAKESRHTQSKTNIRKQEQFHRSFMRTQAIASKMAEKFNADIDYLSHIRPERSWKEIVRKLPRIHFLQPFVSEVYSATDASEYYLTEPYLDGKYTKFNGNNGYVNGGATENDIDKGDGSNNNSDRESYRNERGVDLAALMGNLQVAPGLDMIEEGEETDEEDDESDDDLFESAGNETNYLAFTYKDLKDEYFPQAFSHYSYHNSKQRLMVVDLQGILDQNSDGSRCYRLTDPVIHRRRHAKGVKWNFGRTDRRDKGIKSFFETHKCSDVCRALNLPDARSYCIPSTTNSY